MENTKNNQKANEKMKLENKELKEKIKEVDKKEKEMDNQRILEISSKISAFDLKNKDNQEAKEIANHNIMIRAEKHPLNMPNSGSWFKNIALTNEVKEKLSQTLSEVEGKDFDLSKFEKYQKIPAAFLIESAGLKGYQIGGAQMSEKHANFLVNKDNASAQDVVNLSNYVKEQVKEKYDIELEEEVQYIGF